MSLASEFVDNPTINNLVETSLESEDKDLRLKWIPYEEITDVEPTKIDNLYYAIRKKRYYDNDIMLLLLGSNEECTPTLVSEFARIYSLPTHKYNNDDNNFRRHSTWLNVRNKLIKGFTKSNDNYCYMVANKLFYHCYSRYGFCTCGILRCSPVWCICGHKELSDGWTSNNKQLDEFIKKSQLQTNSPNDAYLEWIPYYCIAYDYLYGLPTPLCAPVKLIPLRITDSTHDYNYAEVKYLLMRHVY
jgi:hypothetical protein